jgi:uncharacterized protein YmfQ (DUF2313 family)
MGYGGYHPFPKKFGGGRPRLRLVHDALNAARGTALDASNSDTVVWVENMAYARAITFDGYGVNDRLGNQRDPDRMTSMLPRWEKILGISPSPTATEKERRDVVKKRRQRFLDATALHSRIQNVMRAELGDVFVQLEYISYANAVINVPDSTYPWGTVNVAAPWSTTTSVMLVLCQKPAGYTEGDYYEAIAKVHPALEQIMPAWMKWYAYRGPQTYPAVSVSGGPSRGGFYLDDPNQLDNCVFSV